MTLRPSPAAPNASETTGGLLKPGSVRRVSVPCEVSRPSVIRYWTSTLRPASSPRVTAPATWTGPVSERSETPAGGSTSVSVTRLPGATRSLASTSTTAERPGARVIASGTAKGGCGGPGGAIEIRAIPVDVAPRVSVIV